MHVHQTHIPALAATAVASEQPDRPASWLDYDKALAPLLACAAEASRMLVSPRLAQAWARALVMHWSRLERLGGLDLGQPLYVLDLAPGDGGLARGVLQALHAELHARGMHGWPVRYVLCPMAGAAPEQAWLDDPRLKDYAARGWLDWATWQGRTGQPLLLGASRFPLFGARNPVAALCLGGLSSLPAQLHGVHFGRLMRARACLQDADPGTQRRTLQCEWQDEDIADALDTAQAVLLAHYRARIVSAPLMLSEPSLALLDALADFSGGCYLMLAADRGVASELQISLGAMAPLAEAAPGEAFLPVNFHALSWHQRNAGARTVNLQRGELELVLHVACRDRRAELDDATWQALVACADAGHPADRWPMCSALPDHPVERLDFHLRCSMHDPWALGVVLEQARALQDAQLLGAGQEAIQALRSSLDACWKELTPAARDDTLCVALTDLLLRLRDWPLVRQVLSQSNTQHAPVLELQRTRLALATGNTAHALQHLRRYLARCPEDTEANELQAALQLRQQHRRHSRWQPGETTCDEELSLELLDELHIEAWLREFRDPGIAQLAGLPEMATAQQIRDYLQAVAAAEGAEYAVMHRDLGFIGAVGLRCLRDMAHIHFWIGTGHQGHGWGARAMQLLCRCLRGFGIRDAFTSVFRHNTRSHRVLAQAGFRRIQYQGQGDETLFDFMHLSLEEPPAAQCHQEILQRLHLMCRAIGEPLQCPPEPHAKGSSQS
jgi:RimJ/RimL family protein N-acetyltransferase